MNDFPNNDLQISSGDIPALPGRKNGTAIAAGRLTAKDFVIATSNILKQAADAGDRSMLTRIGKEGGFDSRAGFGAYKRALKSQLDIDYNRMKITETARNKAEIGSCEWSVILFSDAKASSDRFAITDADGNGLWYGRFFENDRHFNGEQSSGEMAAAKKAVWLASKVAAAVGAKSIRLTLYVDAAWLCYANEVGSPSDNGRRGGKARSLAWEAIRQRVALTVEHVPGAENPADIFTLKGQGFRRWNENNLSSLAIRESVSSVNESS